MVPTFFSTIDLPMHYCCMEARLFQVIVVSCDETVLCAPLTFCLTPNFFFAVASATAAAAAAAAAACGAVAARQSDATCEEHIAASIGCF
jgi:hypothetical protein